MALRARLKHKIAFLLLVPLLANSVLLINLTLQIPQLEQELKNEAARVDRLNLVNAVLKDISSGIANLMMFKIYNDKTYLLKFNEIYSRIRENGKKVHDLAKVADKDEVAFHQFSGTIDDIINNIESLEELMDETKELESIKWIEKISSFLKRLETTGSAVIASEQVKQTQQVEIQVQKFEDLKLQVERLVYLNVAIATLCTIWFLWTFGRRFGVLERNAINIARGTPLEKPLSGNDELTDLDSVIHKLSSELKVTRAKERSLLDNTAEIICSLDEAFRFCEVNPAVEKRLGYTPEELLGSNIQTLVHPDDKEITYDALSRCKNLAAEITFESRLKRKDGGFLSAEWTVVGSLELFHGSADSKSIFCLIHDITERKEAEKLKQEVIAMVSHDLRAPLTSIGLTLEMVREGVVGELDEKGKKFIDRAKVSTTALIHMINDLIDVERFEAGGMTLNYDEAVVDDILTAIEMVRPEAERKKIKLEVLPEPGIIEVDKERLARVVVNLTNNAIKFTPDGKRITVGTKLLEHDTKPHEIEFFVQDEGPGIPAEKVELVFEKFQQVGTGSEGERKGSGLGLAICKAIAESHGGTIGVESTEGEGSRFWFRVPVRRPKNQSASAAQAAQRSSQKTRKTS